MQKRTFIVARQVALAFVAMLLSTVAFAQTMSIKGKVVDNLGDAIIGVNVIEKGTTNGTLTDANGNFNLKVNEGATLSFSFIGYATQEIVVGNQTTIDVVLEEETAMLEDLVVIGYGVQKKSVVSAAIAKVTAEDLAGKAPVRMDNALKGLAAGVNVTSNSGQPGEGSRVRIRGIGTINNSDPLYIVDGMPIEGGLDFVNPNDIESIEVLKDAASGAIYGARAANGVILVTTKKGKKGDAVINYNASWGWQSAARHRDVTGAVDYAILQNEKYVNGGKEAPFKDPYNLTDYKGDAIVGDGTDWQDLVFNDNAPVQNHDLSVSGASDRVSYYLSLGYFDQEGIVGGNYGQSNYDRLTLRSNTQFTLVDASKERNFLNKVDLGVNVAYMRTHSTGISTNSEYGSALGSALYMSPILTPTVTGDFAEEMAATYSKYELAKNSAGEYYTIPGYQGTYQEMNNPLAILDATNPSKNWSHKFVPSASIDIQLWDAIKYRGTYSADMSFWGSDGAVKHLNYFSGNNHNEHTEATTTKAQNCYWQIENTLSYNKTFADVHTIGVTVAHSIMKSKGSDLGGSRWNLVNINKPSINYATGDYLIIVKTDEKTGEEKTEAQVQHSVWGGPYTEHRMISMLGRLSYDYDERYGVTATIRRDGSSRFGTNNRFGIFPSVSAMWNLHNEPYMELPEWLNSAKVRFSWGKNGNDNIGDFQYTTLTAINNNVLLGTTAQKYIGSKADKTANPDLKWEESEQTDLGFDLAFLNSSLTLTVDLFNKKTNGMIIEMPIPSYVGETKPQGNVGDMSNKGIEIELGYKWSIGSAKFSTTANVSYIKNELKNLGNTEGFLNLDGVQGITGTVTRAENGLPFPFFYGYKTAGILQNEKEVNDYVASLGGDKANTLQGDDITAGDVRFVDVNGDKKIDTNDRTNIGNGNPDWTFGLNFNAEWKGFDINMFFQGVQGADVFDATYRQDIYSGNYPTWMLSRWTGEGTSNKYPRLALGDSKNWQVSDLYVCDGSYLRFKTLQIGYTLPKNITEKAFIERFRVFVSADNLVTWTKYWGFDPEIASGGTSLGIDRGVYPQARTYTVGFNLTF